MKSISFEHVSDSLTLTSLSAWSYRVVGSLYFHRFVLLWCPLCSESEWVYKMHAPLPNAGCCQSPRRRTVTTEKQNNVLSVTLSCYYNISYKVLGIFIFLLLVLLALAGGILTELIGQWQYLTLFSRVSPIVIFLLLMITTTRVLHSDIGRRHDDPSPKWMRKINRTFYLLF